MKKLECYLPLDILYEIKRIGNINEIHLKRDSRVVIKKDNRSIILDNKISSDKFDTVIDSLLEHSYHSKLPQIIEGYISLGGGYRAGIAGQAVLRDGTVTNLSEIDSVNIRIPHLIRGVCEPVVEFLESVSYSKGVLIYSPPGVGKTTLLRDLILRLTAYPVYKRIAVIDSRNEIYHSSMSDIPLLDFYSGYPKHTGIEQAIRTMAPDILICDEIGNDGEVQALLNNQGAGVPIIATAHGASYSGIMGRRNIRMMDDAGVFGCYIGIKRRNASEKYIFEINERQYGI